MKVTTDTKGVTTAKLSRQDRKTLAAAKTILLKFAFYNEGELVPVATVAANKIWEVMAEPASKEEDAG